jgi:Cu2+-exporting ATPase
VAKGGEAEAQDQATGARQAMAGHEGMGGRQGMGDHQATGGHQAMGRHQGHEDSARRFWVSLALTIPILVLSPTIQRFLGAPGLIRFPGVDYLSLALATAVYAYGGRPFLTGFVREVRSRAPGMMTLIAVATTTAYAYSAAVVLGLPGEVFFWELATLVDVMLVGHWIEMRSVGEASSALEALARLLPSEAHLMGADQATKDVPIDSLALGDRVLVRPGEKAPADSVIVEGLSSVNESMLTGESSPVAKKPGDTLIGGSVNGEGALVAEIQRTGAGSFLAQVMDLVRQAQESKSKAQNLADRAAFWLTVIAISGGALTFVVWIALARSSVAFAMERAVTVMVIACPHALGLAVPLVVAISTALAAGSGLLIRSRSAFEAARGLDAVIFDKTGTLTEGRFGVSDVLVFGGTGEGQGSALDRDHLMDLAAGVEARSEHPLAQAIAGAARARLPVTDFRSIPGRGAEGTVEGRRVSVVSLAHLAEIGTAAPGGADIERFALEGKTVVFVLVDGEPAAAIALADVIRPESRQAVDDLRRMGVKTIMLTGDNQQVAARVAAELGLDDYFAEVLPARKASKVKEVQARGSVTAMVGDGVNDAPALTQADVGIAIGAGTGVAIESADIILVRSDPRDVAAIIGLARATYRKMVQNLAWATGYNLIAIPLAAGVLYRYGVLLPPALGAVFMSVSTVIVAVNARLLRAPRR